MGGLDASTLLLLRESPSAFVTQRNKAPEGFSPVLLLPWGLQDVGWCCILAVPGLIPFLFAELPALAAASQSSEQTARMVEGLGKHAWYFPSFPPPPPYQLFPSPQILPAWDLRFACLQEGLHNRLLLSSVFVGGGQEWEDPVCTPGSLQSPDALYALMAGLQGAPSPPQLPWGWLSQGGSQASLAFSPPCTPYKPPAMPQQDCSTTAPVELLQQPLAPIPTLWTLSCSPTWLLQPTGAPCAYESSVPQLRTHTTPRVSASLFTWVRASLVLWAHASLAPWVHASWFL